MRLLAQALHAGIALAALAPVFLSSLPQASALIVPRGDVNASLVPLPCVTTCQPVLSYQSTCGSDLKCRCTDTNGNSFAQCMDCVVSVKPDTLMQSIAQGVLNDFNKDCASNNTPISSLVSPCTTNAKTNDALIRAPHLIVTGIAALQFVFVLARMFGTAL
ncbi:hypothetical protein B0H13DRAFT_1995553 [Mycena leptocephala]|nr:hypothetical protein B0H13DRAFT_1995553 [Mycena leptocephala]